MEKEKEDSEKEEKLIKWINEKMSLAETKLEK
jgi:hypothetical protein